MDLAGVLHGVRKRLGRNLRAARIEAGLTLEELAVRSHIAPATLIEIEKGGGNPDFEMLAALARAVRRAPFELLDD
jgi:transcriptional regulator with XRE-family HTH domain